jgi:hypothetical protein
MLSVRHRVLRLSRVRGVRVFEHREEETHSVCLTFLPFEALWVYSCGF